MEGLNTPEKSEVIDSIARMATNGNITLMYGAKDAQRNNARVLEEMVALSIKEQSRKKR